MKPNPLETARLIVENQGDILLVKRRRKANIRGGQWDLPGGAVDEDESFEQAACREFKEETGLIVPESDVEYISTTIDRDGDRTFIRHYGYVGGMMTRKSVELSDESTASLWLPPERALDLVTYAPHLIALEHSMRA